MSRLSNLNIFGALSLKGTKPTCRKQNRSILVAYHNKMILVSPLVLILIKSLCIWNEKLFTSLITMLHLQKERDLRDRGYGSY